jgi:hypothetical protein
VRTWVPPIGLRLRRQRTIAQSSNTPPAIDLISYAKRPS